MTGSVRKHELGFMEIHPKPTVEELRDFYNKEYFTRGTYAREYTEEELVQKLIPFYEAEYIIDTKPGSMIDIGCGEGYSLSFFQSRGWRVSGLDFTSDGVKHCNPDMQQYLHEGNIFEILDEMAENGREKFDLVICNNVLEHVLNPIDFLEKLKHLLAKDGVCRIQAPNDYSALQNTAIKNGLGRDEFWLAPPAHLSYFNKETLLRTLNETGYRVVDLLGDFPIDLFLLNPDSNYVLDESRGKNCHNARVTFDNMLASQGIEELVSFRRGCGGAGIGRNMIAYCTLDT